MNIFSLLKFTTILIIAYSCIFSEQQVTHLSCPQAHSNLSNDTVALKLSSLARDLYATGFEIHHMALNHIKFPFKTCHQLEYKEGRYYLDDTVYTDILKYNESEILVKDSNVYFFYEIGRKIKRICPFSKYFILRIECDLDSKRGFQSVDSSQHDRCALVTHLKSRASCEFKNFNSAKVESYINENSRQIFIYPTFTVILTFFSFLICMVFVGSLIITSSDEYLYYLDKYRCRMISKTYDQQKPKLAKDNVKVDHEATKQTNEPKTKDAENDNQRDKPNEAKPPNKDSTSKTQSDTVNKNVNPSDSTRTTKDLSDATKLLDVSDGNKNKNFNEQQDKKSAESKINTTPSIQQVAPDAQEGKTDPSKSSNAGTSESTANVNHVDVPKNNEEPLKDKIVAETEVNQPGFDDKKNEVVPDNRNTDLTLQNDVSNNKKSEKKVSSSDADTPETSNLNDQKDEKKSEDASLQGQDDSQRV